MFRPNFFQKTSTEVDFFDLSYTGETTHQDTRDLKSYLTGKANEGCEPKFILPIQKDGSTVGFQIVFEKTELVPYPDN